MPYHSTPENEHKYIFFKFFELKIYNNLYWYNFSTLIVLFSCKTKGIIKIDWNTNLQVKAKNLLTLDDKIHTVINEALNTE